MAMLGLLVVLMTLGLPAVAVNDWVCFNIPDAGFTDVLANNPHRADINCLKHYDITTQEGTYRPTDPVTRGEMSLFLTRLMAFHHLPAQPSVPPFIDIGSVTSEMQLAIAQLVELGISSGTTQDMFEPSSLVPRWQMALFLARSVRIMTGQVPPSSAQTFSDLVGVSAEGDQAIAWLRDIGIVAGTGPTTFSPFALVTREQMASFLIRTYKHIFVLPTELIARQLGICNAEGTTCNAEIDFPQGLPFGLRGGIVATYPFAAVADEAEFRAASSIVYFVIDGVSVPTQVSEVVSGRTIIRWYYLELPNGLTPGNHTIERQTLIEGSIVASYLVTFRAS